MLRDQVGSDLLEILDSIQHTPAGALRVSAAESALAEARASGSFAAELIARLNVVEAMHYVPATPDMLVHIGWLRQVIDRSELVEDPDTRRHVLWLLKWAPTQMLALPQVALDEVERAVDDLEDVYRRNGHARRPVLGFRARLAKQRGADEEVRRVIAEWTAEPRDDLSDCLACDTAEQGLAWERTDHARALAAWKPLFDGDQRCTEEPQRVRAHAALLCLDAGDAAAAASHLRAAWEVARSESLNNQAVAYCLVAWTRMGNVDRALPALLDRVGWLDEIATPADRMTWTSAAALVLDAAAAGGIAPDEMAGRPCAEVREEWHRTATDLAGAFDARNGTSYCSDRVADWLDLDRVSSTPHLPPVRLRQDGRNEPRRPAGIAAHADALTAALLGFDPAVRELLAGWVRHRDELLASASPEDEEHVALLDRHAAMQSGDPATLLDRAEQAARSTGDEVALLRVEAERSSLLDEGDVRVARLTEIAEDLGGRGRHLDAAAVWRTAARHVEAHDEAERMSLAAAEAARADGDRAREGLAIIEAARYAHASPDHAADLLRRARPLVESEPALQLMADDLEARLLASVGRADDAIELLERSLDADHSPVHSIASRLLLCDLLTDADRLQDLLGVSERVVVDAVELEDPVVLALGQRFHGLALIDAGRPAEALELLDAALPVIGEHVPDLLGPLRWAHARALTMLGEPGPARTSYAAAATAFEAAGRRNEAAHAQFQAGGRAWDLEDLGAAEAHYDAAIDFAGGEHDAAVYAEASRLRAIVRRHAGSSEDTAELDAVPGDVRRRMSEWGLDERPGGFSLSILDAQVLRDGANLLAGTGRHEEAAIRMQSAADVWPDDEEAWHLRAERGLFLAAAGRYDDAEHVIREALGHLGGDRWHQARHQLVQRWVSILDDAGRTEDADRIYNERPDQP